MKSKHMMEVGKPGYRQTNEKAAMLYIDQGDDTKNVDYTSLDGSL